MCTWNIISLVLYDRQSLHIAKTLQTKKKKATIHVNNFSLCVDDQLDQSTVFASITNILKINSIGYVTQILNPIPE